MMLGIWAAVFFDYHDRHHGVDLPLVVTVAADSPPASAPLQVIPHQSFEGGDIPLDGHVYEDCTFADNACLLYDGRPYRLENATFETRPRVCVHEQGLLNYVSLMEKLKLFPEGKNRALVPWWK
jgi:hypothetical protein